MLYNIFLQLRKNLEEKIIYRERCDAYPKEIIIKLATHHCSHIGTIEYDNNNAWIVNRDAQLPNVIARVYAEPIREPIRTQLIRRPKREKKTGREITEETVRATIKAIQAEWTPKIEQERRAIKSPRVKCRMKIGHCIRKHHDPQHRQILEDGDNA